MPQYSRPLSRPALAPAPVRPAFGTVDHNQDALVRRPGFISDPVIDTSKNQIIYSHCVAMTKPFGRDGATSAYRICSHSEDRKGAAIQSLLPPGYMTTTLEINPVTREVLFHQAKSAGNNASDMACRTKLEAYVKGDIEKLTENWRMGWHRVTLFGDLKDSVQQLCERLKLKLIEEAWPQRLRGSRSRLSGRWTGL